MRIIKYTIEGVSSNLSDSSQYEITWSTLSSCVALQCLIGNNGAEFAISDEVEGCNPCIQYTIRTIGCTNCPNIIKTICFCNESGDCPPCHTCIDGECVALCDNCDPVTGDCVDCKDDNDCPGDMICIQGGCQCPQGKWDPISGKCVECVQGDINPNNKCLICVGNKWTTKKCANGVVDPNTCECIGCNNNNDCKGPNECCYNGICLCCKDTAIYDPITKTCIPKPPCGPDTPCPACYDCIDGQCVPRICPSGYVCIEELDECKPECDCNKPTCNTKDACITSNSGKCYCSSCEGGCLTNNDCGPGCYCDNGKCKPKPCKGSCVNGTDCGPGCGCLNGECVPCNSANCNTNPALCSKILGCKCNGNSCVDAEGCLKENCSNTFDCKKGCTCDEGTCEDCANYSCEECSNHEGCKCVNGICVSDPDYKCTDTFKLEKIDETCDLKAELSMKEGCDCPIMTLDTRVTQLTNSDKNFAIKFVLEVRKGNRIISPRVDEIYNSSIADNDLPILGDIELVLKKSTKKVNLSDNSYTIQTVSESMSFNLNNKAFAETQLFSLLKIGEEVEKTNSYRTTIYSYLFTFKQSSSFKFPNNCNYPVDGRIIGEYNITSNDFINTNFLGNSNYERFINIKSTDKRNPRFTWFRGKGLLEKYRSVYIPRSGNIYKDILYGPKDNFNKGKYPLQSPEGGLWSGRDWRVENDCSCERVASLNNVTFCNPTGITASFNSCNTAIKFNNFPIPCDVNQDIRQFGSGIPDDAQVLYELWINGAKFKTFVHNASGGSKMVVWDSTKTGNERYTQQNAVGVFMSTPNEEEIKTAVIKLNHGGSCDLNLTVPPITPKDFTYQIDCNGGNSPGTYKITVNKGAGENEVVSVEGATIAGNTFVLYAPKGQNFTIKAKFKNCGKKEKVVNECGCEDFNPTVTLSGNYFCTSGSITISGTNINGSVLKYTEDGIQKEITSFPYTTNTNTTKTITLVSIERNGCKIDLSDSKTITKLDKPTLTLTADKTSICSGDTVVLTVNGTQGATFDLWKGGAKEQTGLTANTTINVSPTSSASYQLKNIKLNSCTGNDSNVVTISVTPGMQEPIVTQDCGISNTNTTVNFDSNVTYNGVTNNQFIVPSNIGTMTVSYGSGVCSKTMTVQIDNCNCPTITANLTGPSTICAGEVGNFSVSNVEGGMPPYTYYWLYCDAPLLGSGPSVSFTVDSSCTLDVVIKDLQGCSVIKSMNVTALTPQPFTVQPLEQGGYSMSPGILTVCDTVDTITLIGDPIGMYYWDLYSGTYSGTYGITNSVLPINMSGLTSGAVISITDTTNCPTTLLLRINKEECGCTNPPSAYFTAPISSTFIGMHPIIFTVSVTNPTGTYGWTTNGTGTFSDITATSVKYNPSINDIGNGSVTITYSITNPPISCESFSVSKTITLIEECCPGFVKNNVASYNESVNNASNKVYNVLQSLSIVKIIGECVESETVIFGVGATGDMSKSRIVLNNNTFPGVTNECVAIVTGGTSDEYCNSMNDVVIKVNAYLSGLGAPFNSMSISIPTTGNLEIDNGFKLNAPSSCYKIKGRTQWQEGGTIVDSPSCGAYGSFLVSSDNLKPYNI